MWMRPVTMTIAFFSAMLTSVFALTDMMWDFDQYIWRSVGLLIFGNAYFMAVLFQAMLHDIMEHPQRHLRASFWLASTPTALYFYRLYELAFL